ncbi:Lmo0654 family protein [Listeria seeligeri]|uniref:Lmo0654 family protein n=1 Tax=Listeria seeligeri TaxID=1640 RepID=UPI0031CC91F1
MAHENLRELEDRLIGLRQEYQEVLSETRDFEDPQLQNGPINASEVRLSALRHEILEVEKKIKKVEGDTK